MANLQELRSNREEAGKAILQLRDKIARKIATSTAKSASWEKSNKDFDDLGRKIEVLETRGDKISAELAGNKGNKPGNEDNLAGNKQGGIERKKRSAEELEELKAVACHGWFVRQMGLPLTDEHKRAAKITGFNLRAASLDFRIGQKRAQSVGTPGAGGYAVPTSLVGAVEYGMKEWDCVRSVADVFSTPGGNPYDWVTSNDTGNAGTLLAENTTIGAAVDIAILKTTFNAYKFNSGLVLVSAELEMDEAVGLVKNIGSLLGERLGRGQEAYNTTGTGSSQPAGIVTGSTLGVTAASATAIASDEVISLYHSVDPAYRRDPSFGFMMHDNVAMALRKLKASGTGEYLWQLDMRSGEPPTLLGRPVAINQSMQSTIVTATKTIIAGAFKKFKIRDAGPVRIKRLDERYADIDQIGFVALSRMDSKVLNPGTNPIKHLIQA